MPPPAPAGRSGRAGLVTAAAGVGLLVLGNGSRPLLVVAGTLATVLGVLLLSPAILRVAGDVARPLPVGARLACRDLSRYRSRSAAALAAVGLALGIPVAVVVFSASAEAAAGLPNLPPDAAIAWTQDPSQPDGVSPFYSVDTHDEGFSPYLPALEPADLDRLARLVERTAGDLGLRAVPLRAVVDPQVDDPDGRRAVTVARRSDIGYLDVGLVYAATPELLAPHGVDRPRGLLTTAPPGPADMVVDHDRLWLANAAEPPEQVGGWTSLDAAAGSLPGTFLGSDEIERRGWTTAPVGWLLTGDGELGPERLGALREAAIGDHLVVEGPEPPADLTPLRWTATGIGAAAALAVVAMTVGLIRVEAAPDLRVLVANGASSRIQRTLTATTAGSLVAAGAVLGTLGAYATIAAGYLDDPGTLVPVPWHHLTVVTLVVPAVATAGAWLLAGRPPSGLARTLE
jgi:putative ABC transport system permease protein